MTDINVPRYDAMMNPVLRALKELGGSGTIHEIDARASEIAGLTDEQLEDVLGGATSTDDSQTIVPPIDVCKTPPPCSPTPVAYPKPHTDPKTGEVSGD